MIRQAAGVVHLPRALSFLSNREINVILLIRRYVGFGQQTDGGKGNVLSGAKNNPEGLQPTSRGRSLSEPGRKRGQDS